MLWHEEDRKKNDSVKKIESEDEDVRPAGGNTALYLLCENLEILSCPRYFRWKIYSLSSVSFLSPLLSFLQELAEMQRLGKAVSPNETQKEWQGDQKRLILRFRNPSDGAWMFKQPCLRIYKRHKAAWCWQKHKTLDYLYTYIKYFVATDIHPWCVFAKKTAQTWQICTYHFVPLFRNHTGRNGRFILTAALIDQITALSLSPILLSLLGSC